MYIFYLIASIYAGASLVLSQSPEVSSRAFEPWLYDCSLASAAFARACREVLAPFTGKKVTIYKRRPAFLQVLIHIFHGVRNYMPREELRNRCWHIRLHTKDGIPRGLDAKCPWH